MHTATELLLEHGPAALTIDAIVARSGVAKSTLYRHWADRDALVADVFGYCLPDLAGPARDLPFEATLRGIIQGVAGLMADEHWRRLIPALLMLREEKTAIKAIHDQMKRNQVDVIGNVLRRGVDEGELRPEVADDIERAMTLLVGPILMACLVENIPTDQALADHVVDQFLAANRKPSTPAT